MIQNNFDTDLNDVSILHLMERVVMSDTSKSHILSKYNSCYILNIDKRWYGQSISTPISVSGKGMFPFRCTTFCKILVILIAGWFSYIRLLYLALFHTITLNKILTLFDIQMISFRVLQISYMKISQHR